MTEELKFFIEKHVEKADELSLNLYSEICTCLHIVGLEPHYHVDPPQYAFKRQLENLRKMNALDATYKQFSHYKGYIDTIVKPKIGDDIQAAIVGEVLERLSDILFFLSEQKKEFDNLLIRKIEKLKDCPYGQKKRRTKNALAFQMLVAQLFSLLFIDELNPLDLQKLENPKKQRRDAAFRVTDTFDTQIRCGYKFSHLFIECKNYEQPSHRDVMQVFGYTMLYNASAIFQIPLSLIVSRKNPSIESYAIDYRDKIYHKRIDQGETRVILFFDLCDLEDMVQMKINDGDPSLKIKEKIEAFTDRYMGLFGG